MRFILYFLFLFLGHNECAKPRSVNLALETVFEFNNETDVGFVETVKGFLANIKDTIDNSYQSNDYQTRRMDSLTFTEFIENSINVLKSYNDLDLAYFIELLDTEINEHDYRNCEVKITNEFSLRSFFADKLSDARNLPVTEIRRSLDNILRELRTKREKRRRIYNFLNSLVKRRTQERFRSILNYLQLYRRRQMEPTITLRTVVEKSIRSLIKDYICNLNYSSWRKIRHMFKIFYKDLRMPVHNLKKDYKWDRQVKKAVEDNDDLYDLEILKDVSNAKRDTYVNRNSKENKYQINTNEEYQIQEKKEERSKNRKGKVNISLTNSDDILDLKMDYGETQDENNSEHTKSTIKRRRTRKPKEAESELSISKRDNEESTQDRNNYFEKSKSFTMHRKTKSKRHRTFVTLYPEIISYMTRSNRKIKKTTDYFRNDKRSQERKSDIEEGKKERRKNKKTTQGLISRINTNINIGLHKSTNPKLTNSQNSHIKRFRIKSNLSTLKHEENKRAKTIKATTAFKSEEIPKKEFQIRDHAEVDHFGSLYKLRNKQTPEMVYRGFRKSNDLATLGTTEDTNVNTTVTTTLTTKTYGTLAFWKGTKVLENITTKRTRGTETLTTDKIVNRLSTRNTTRLTSNSTKTTSLDANDKANNTVFKSLVAGIKRNDSDIQIKSTRSKSNQETIKLQNDTKYLVEPFLSLKTTHEPTMISQVDLRRFLNNSILNEVGENPKMKQLSDRFQEDLKKIFLVPPPQHPRLNDSIKDPIDEIEEAFNL
ncbi:uncharacterized protein LOC125061563 [Pieris napi]|uniref:uncharacterized protein LOC125061563 n=1 Tax=Pieris napi TaxID=78633 RepID=UPI001FB9EA11|nr:uncharacterized protein LOC125061563 [Pieris napi]